MKNRTAAISLAGSHLGDTRHVCTLFSSDDEEYRVLLPFMKDGCDRGDRAIHVVNPHPFFVPPERLVPEFPERQANRAMRRATAV
ncbi:MAG: hypothetical protein ACJ79S_06330 [Gemmatimonadaceae bacterium]